MRSDYSGRSVPARRLTAGLAASLALVLIAPTDAAVAREAATTGQGHDPAAAEYREDIEQLRDEQAAVRAEADRLAAQQREVQDRQGRLAVELQEATDRLAALEAEYAELTDRAARTEQDVRRLTDERLERRARLGGRARSLYTSGAVDPTLLMFSGAPADEMTEILDTAHYVAAMANRDQSAIEAFRATATRLDRRRRDLAEDRREVADVQAEVEAARTELNARFAEAAALEDQLVALREDARINLGRLEERERTRRVEEQARLEEIERRRREEEARRRAAEQAAREQAAREQAAAEQAAAEQTARQQAAAEQTAREQAEREQAARDRAAAERRQRSSKSGTSSSSGSSGSGGSGGSGGSSGSGSSGGPGGSSGSGGSGGGMACPQAQPRSFTNDWGAPRSGGRSHQGTDIFGSMGGNVHAITSGTVSFTRIGASAGLFLGLRGDDGSTYWYMHLSSFVAGAGDQVAAGEVIARNGDTGNAEGTPPHIHFEYHPGGGGPVNPYPLLRSVCG